MDWSSFVPNIISTLIGALAAFLLGFIAFRLQSKSKDSAAKKEWDALLTDELNVITATLKSFDPAEAYSFINAPILESFLKNSSVQQLFPYHYLKQLCNVYCKIQNYNKYVQLELLSSKGRLFEGAFFQEKLDDIIDACEEAQKKRHEK